MEKLIVIYALVALGLYLAYETLSNWQSGFSTGSNYLSSSTGTRTGNPFPAMAATLNLEAENTINYFKNPNWKI